MKVYFSISALTVLGFCLFSSTPLQAQRAKKWTQAEILANVKVGQWIEIDGAIQPDQSVTAVEIEFRAGDFLDDDWRLLATVKSVSPEQGEFKVFSVPVRVTKETEFDEGIASLDDIKPEMLVKLEGSYLKEGVFLAKEVDNRAKKLRAEPQFDKMLEVVGKIAQIDEAKRVITVMGIDFHITIETEGKSLIK